MLRIRFRLFMAALTAAAGLLGARPPAKEPPLTLDQCLELAVRRNPLVLSSFEKIKASQARERQALALPQPTLSLDSDLQAGALDLKSSGESYWGFSELIEFPGKRSVRGRIAARESDAVRSDLDLLKLDLGYQVKQAFYGILLAEEKIACARRDLELSEDFLNKTELRSAAGDIAEVEVMRARVENAKSMNALKVAQNERRIAAGTLNYLLARKSAEPLEIRGELKGAPVALDLEALKARALSVRPELKSVGFAQEGETLKKAQAAQSYLPDFDLGWARHRLAGAPTTWEFTLSVSVPLFFWQPVRGPAAEAEANLRSLGREAEHLRADIAREVEEAATNAQSAADQIKLFEERILTQAEEVYRIYLFKFEKGEIGGIELIEARRSLNEARRDYADALFTYRTTIAALERSVGYSLERGQHD